MTGPHQLKDQPIIKDQSVTYSCYSDFQANKFSNSKTSVPQTDRLSGSKCPVSQTDVDFLVLHLQSPKQTAFLVLSVKQVQTLVLHLQSPK